MAFGLPDSDTQLDYDGYLQVPELTALQRLRSDPPQHDETLFIIIHQTYELWFKQILHEIDAVIALLENDEPLEAYRLMRRCIEIQRVLVAQISVLETMTPLDFLAFRDHLFPASGFQSSQFREIEFLSGLKMRGYLKNYVPGTPARARLEARLEAPSLRDAFYALLRRRGFALPDEAAGNGEADDTAQQARIDALRQIYVASKDHYDLFLLAEGLIEYDEMFVLWRMRHVQMVERVIGGRPGTGGSEGAAYLRTTLERRLFPALWALRTHLSLRGAATDRG